MNMFSPEDKARIANWETVWNGHYSRAQANPDPEFDISPWVCSYTGLPYSAPEMREWVDASVSRIAPLIPPKGSVLEIGCGTGLMLYRVIGLCSRFVGVDLSESALCTVRAHLAQKNIRHAHLEKLAATEISKFGETFDVIFMNSVAQYFPNSAYLEAVLNSALPRLSPTGSIFLGDIRSLDLSRVFHFWSRFQKASDEMETEKFAALAERKILQEREASYAESFFHDYARKNNLVCTVQLRRGTFHNEMSCFRYDVVLQKNPKLKKRVRVEEKILNHRVAPAVALEKLVAERAAHNVGGLRQLVKAVQGAEPETYWERGKRDGLVTEIYWDGLDCFKASFFTTS